MPSPASSSPERPKRRLSPLSQAYDKRPRPSQFDATSNHVENQVESKDRENQIRQTMPSPSIVNSSIYRPYQPKGISSSGSSSPEDTGARYMDRGPQNRVPSITGENGPSRRFSGPRWITDGDSNPLHQPSSTSSSSSSHHHAAYQPLINSEERGRSPPLGVTLSTGQPLVNPPLKTQAAFVGKLFSMLEDDEIRTTGLIHWSNSGTTFTCPNPTEFSK
jgi:hypothetical protein